MTSRSRSDSSLHARILLVDDNKSGLSARRAILDELGHRTTTASGGEDAIEQFSHGKFDILVTDYRMPKVDGLELIRRVRAVDPAMPIILLSGYVEAYGLDESNTGADIVLPKSANEVAHLIRAVNRLLRRKVTRKPPGRQQTQPTSKRHTAGR
jgi:CheY-like chemotaxis protein